MLSNLGVPGVLSPKGAAYVSWDHEEPGITQHAPKSPEGATQLLTAPCGGSLRLAHPAQPTYSAQQKRAAAQTRGPLLIFSANGNRGYFMTPKMASLAALATRNFRTFLAATFMV